MFEIWGSVTHGCGVASETVAAQLPAIAAGFPEVRGCHPGTINVTLDHPLLVLNPDYRTPPIAWKSNRYSHPGELFDFVRIEFGPAGGSGTKGWLYISHTTVHRADPRVHEILAPKIDAPPLGTRVSIRIDRPRHQMPHGAGEILVL